MEQIIGKELKKGNNVKIGHFCIIGDNVTIGDNVKIDNFTTISDNVTIGNDVTIGSHVVIKDTVAVGEKSIIGDGCQLFSESTVGSNVRLIANVVIEDGAKVGLPGKEDSFRYPVVIEPGVIIGGDAVIEQGVHIRANAYIKPDVTVGLGAVVRGVSLITADVVPFAAVKNEGIYGAAVDALAVYLGFADNKPEDVASATRLIHDAVRCANNIDYHLNKWKFSSIKERKLATAVADFIKQPRNKMLMGNLEI